MSRWLVAAFLAPLVASAEVEHEIEIRIDPGSSRVLVEDTITHPGIESTPIHLPGAAGITDLRLDGLPVPSGTRWLESVSSAQLRYAWHVPSKSVDATGSAILDSDGGYLPASAGWIAQLRNGVETFRFTVSAPGTHRVVATGNLLAESISDAEYRATFELPKSSSSPSLFVGPYEVSERYAEGVRLRTYFYADQSDLADDYLLGTAEYLRHYSELIGAYPFAEFHVVAGPLPVGLGFRNLTYVSRRILGLPFMRGRSLAHEILHSWWGSGVRVNYAGGNWAEGLTTYLADYALAERSGDDAALQMRLAWLRDYSALPPGRDHALQAFRGRDHEASQVVGYGKGVFVFHMLRKSLGAKIFRAAIQRFWRDNRSRTAGWEELRIAFELASGTELGSFFAQWVSRAGAPSLDLETARVVVGAGEHAVEVVLLQDDPAYALQVPIRVDTTAGSERFTMSMDVRRVVAQFPVSDRPTRVTVDPDFDLFRRLSPEELPPTLRDTALAEDVAVVLETNGPRETAAAEFLAARLLDLPARPLAALKRQELRRPLLLIGVGNTLPPAFRMAGVEDIPSALSVPATARVWAIRDTAGWPRLVVLASDLPSLEALIRPLPHYRRKSWLLFRASTVFKSDIWSVRDGPLLVEFPG